MIYSVYINSTNDFNAEKLKQELETGYIWTVQNYTKIKKNMYIAKMRKGMCCGLSILKLFDSEHKQTWHRLPHQRYHNRYSVFAQLN